MVFTHRRFLLFLLLFLPYIRSECLVDPKDFGGFLVLIVDQKCDPLRSEQQRRAAQLAIEEVNSGKPSKMQIDLGTVIDTCQNPSTTLQTLLETMVETGQVCSQPTPFLAITDTNKKIHHLVNGVLINFDLVHFNAIQVGVKPAANFVIRFEPSDLPKTLISLVKQLRWRTMFLLHTNDSISIQDAHLFEIFAAQNGICVFSNRNYPQREINRVILISHDPQSAQDLLLNNIIVKKASQVLVTVLRVGLLPRLRFLHQQQCSDKVNQSCILVVMQSISQQMHRVPLTSQFLQQFYNQTNKPIYRNEEKNSLGKYMNDEDLALVSDVSLDAVLQATHVLSTASQLAIRYCQNRMECLTTLISNRTKWREFLSDIVVFENGPKGRRVQRKLNGIRNKYYAVFIAQGQNQVFHIGDIHGQGQETTIPVHLHMPRSSSADFEDELCHRVPLGHLTKSIHTHRSQESTYMLLGMVAGTGTCMIASVGGCALVLYRSFYGKGNKSGRRNDRAESVSVASLESLSVSM